MVLGPSVDACRGAGSIPVTAYQEAPAPPRDPTSSGIERTSGGSSRKLLLTWLGAGEHSTITGGGVSAPGHRCGVMIRTWLGCDLGGAGGAVVVEGKALGGDGVGEVASTTTTAAPESLASGDVGS